MKPIRIILCTDEDSTASCSFTRSQRTTVHTWVDLHQRLKWIYWKSIIKNVSIYCVLYYFFFFNFYQWSDFWSPLAVGHPHINMLLFLFLLLLLLLLVKLFVWFGWHIDVHYLSLAQLSSRFTIGFFMVCRAWGSEGQRKKTWRKWVWRKRRKMSRKTKAYMREMKGDEA